MKGEIKMNEYLDLIKSRRSNYSLGRNVDIDNEKIVELVETAVLYNPSPYNSQASKVIVLFGDEHDRLWEAIKAALEQIVKPERFERTRKKIDGFKSAYGTILYFSDDNIMNDLRERFPKYAQNFTLWDQQSSGMLQYAIWTGLGTLDLGASLQHYNEVIEDQVREMYNVAPKYRLLAQMPFGSIEEGPKEKEIRFEDRIEVIGS